MSTKSRKRRSTATDIVDLPDAVDAKKNKESEEPTTTISELEFKFLLRDQKTVSDGLAKFTATAEAYNDGVPCQDIVSGYCRSSPSCAELWTLIDPTNTVLKINDIGFVFQCLEQILTRIRNDLVKFSSTGEAIVQKILAAHMGQLYNCLRDQNKSKTIKAALKLLIAMVLLSDKSKRAVLIRLNFGHQNFPSLFRRRNRKDPQDVRSCVVLLTLAFLLDSDNSVVNTLVQQRTFLQMTIAGLKYDTKDMVVDILATLMDKVVKCQAVTKTDKIKLFSEVTLRQFCDLYQWLGPRGWTAGVKKRQDEDGVDTSSEKTSEDKEVVATVVHDFLTELCCSHKHGLNFFDKTMGTGTRNQNQLLSHFLVFLVKKMDDLRICDLIISILCACPDQIKSVLNILCPFLAPRWSEKWGSLMDWLVKLYSTLAETVQVNTSGDVHSVVSMATVFCLPPPKIAAIIVQSLKHEDVQVRHKSLQLVRVLAKKAYSIHQQLAKSNVNTSLTEESLLDVFTTNILKTLPQVAQIFMCVDRVSQKLSQREKKQEEQDFDLSEHTVTILQVLSLYQNLSPTLISDRPKDLAKLIEMVGHLQQRESESTDDEMEIQAEAKGGDEEDEQTDEDKRWLPQLYLLKLLSETDARKISLGREGLLEKLLTSASQSGYSKDLIISLISKMLQSVEVLYGHGKELNIWLEAALRQGSRVTGSKPPEPNCAVFLARSLATLINNPTPYVDRMMEVLGGGFEDEDEKDLQNTAGTKKNAIDAILLMEDVKLDELLKKSLPPQPSEEQKGLDLPLSPLTLVVLDSLDNSKEGDANQLEYISRVLVGMVHAISDPVSLARVIQCSKSTLPDGVKKYVQFWQSGKPSRMVALDPLQPGMFGSFTSTLMGVLFCKSDQELGSDTLAQLTNDITEMTARDRIISLEQLVLYMGETARWAAKDSQYKQVLQELMNVAEVVIDHIGEDEKWDAGAITNAPELKKVHSLSTPSKETNQEMAHTKSVDAKAGVGTSSVFSDLFSSVGNCRVGAADAVKRLLENQGLNEQLFNRVVLQTTKKKSPKKKVDAAAEYVVPCIVSTFMCSVLEKCKNFTWFVKETKIAERYLCCIMDRIFTEGHELPPKLYSSYLAIIKSLYSLFDLVGLSKCLVQLLLLPHSAFIDTDSGGGDIVREKPLGKILCKLLNRWVQLVGDDPTFINQSQMQQWTNEHPKTCFGQNQAACSHESQGPSTKGCISLKTSFSLESSTNQLAASFAPVFELLPHYQNESLQKFVIFTMGHLPEMVSIFRPNLFVTIFQFPLKLKTGSLEEEVVTVLIEKVRACFLQCDQWLLEHGEKAYEKGKRTLIKCYLKARNTFSDCCTETVGILKNAAVAQLKVKSPASSDDELLEVYELLSLAVSDKDENFQKLLTEAMKTAIAKPNTPNMMPHFKVLKVSAKFSHGSGTKRKSEFKDTSPQTLLLDLGLAHLTYLTSSKSNRHAEMEDFLFDLFPELLTETNETNLEFLLPYWGKLVMNTLRHLYTNPKLLKLLSCLVPRVYALDSDHKTATGPPTATRPHVNAQTMFQMCVSHTAFLNVMMSQENLLAKDELIHLLYALGDLDPSVYKSQLSKVFVGAYGAKLSKADQRLLIMIEKCSQDSEKKFECPTLWGKSALEHDTVSQVLGPSLDKEASVKSVLEQIEPACLQDSILNFPVRRAFLSSRILDASDFKSKPECYDPNFLLRLFVQILSPDKLVPLRMFVERGCLSYLLIALSSHDATNRLLAYQALNDFYLHSDGSRLQERVEVNFMLDLLNASRVKDGQKLSFVVALFFARVVKLFMYPADPLYMPIFRFLVAKPEMDLSNVPEFYKLFYSSGVQYKQERNWVLSLLCDGMRETADYWLYQKKHIFKILMCFHDSVLSDVHSQGLILSALRNACKEKFVAVDLVKNHGLVSWLLGVVENLENRPQHSDLVCDIVHTLWISLTTSKYVVGSQRNQSSLNDSSVLNVNVSLDESKAVGRKASIKDNKKKADKVTAIVEKREGESSEVDGESSEEDGESSEEDKESSDEDGESSEEDGDSSDEEDSNENTEEEDMSGTEDPQTEKRGDTVFGKKDELVHQLPSPRATSVPKSTQVEMGFIVKNLICHLSNVSSLDSLRKILEVIHSMISRSGDSETQDGVHEMSHTPTNQEHSFSSHRLMGDNADALRLLNLSPNETCLLLYHTAKKLQEEMTARAAEDVLKSRGVATGLVARQPNRKSSKPEAEPQKAGKGETTVDGAEAEDKDDEDALSKTLNHETLLVKQGKPGHDAKNVKVEEKKKLLKLMSSIASLTGTLQMV